MPLTASDEGSIAAARFDGKRGAQPRNVKLNLARQVPQRCFVRLSSSGIPVAGPIEARATRTRRYSGQRSVMPVRYAAARVAMAGHEQRRLADDLHDGGAVGRQRDRRGGGRAREACEQMVANVGRLQRTE